MSSHRLLSLAKRDAVMGISAVLALSLAATLAWWHFASLDWGALHREDLAAIHDAIRDNHPGAVDSENPAFARWLEKGMAEARGREAAIEDRAGYIYSLIAYASGFGDTHLSVEPQFEGAPLRWPGFIVGLGAGQAIVVDRDTSDATSPPLGAVIESCDGESLERLIASGVLPFGLDQRVPANRVQAISHLFLDKGNPFAPAPSECRLNISGEAEARKLAYRPAPEDFSARFEAALFGPPAKLGWSEPAPGVTWIGIPSFDYGDANSKKLRKVVDRLSADANRIKEGRTIVFDVRGNAGGSSLWGDEIRNSLWDPEAIEKHAPRDPSGVDWRASPGNRDYMLDMISTVIPKVGSQSNVGLALTGIARGLSDAAWAKQIFWREGNAKPGPAGGLTQRRPRAEKPLFPAKIIILSNGSCASACLDFADRILQMPGTYLAGFATSGDGLYTESRAVNLPSGRARLHLAMKVYRGRPRGDMEVYAPDIAYDGAWSDGRVRRWLLKAIATGKP